MMLAFSLLAGMGGRMPAQRKGAAEQPLTASELAGRVDRHYDRLKSLSVEFVESYQGMGMVRKESGVLLLQKPGRMRWSYAEPAGKLFVIDGKFAYFYTPGDAQAQRVPAKQLDDLRSPLRLLLGRTQIERELSGLTMAPVAGGFRLAGVPKGLEKRVQSLSLDVTGDGRIGAMRIEEVDGAVTEFAFAGERANAAVGAGDFVFTPPQGVAVVDGMAPI